MQIEPRLEALLVLFPSVVAIALYVIVAVSFTFSLVRWRRRPGATPERAPRVTILKPLAGVDEDLDGNLESFAALDYPAFEILLGVAAVSDPAHEAARRFVRANPRLNARVVLTDPDAAVNPKVAVIWKPYDGGNLKIMGGRAFRAPSIYELFYNDAGKTQVASPDLRPEAVYSGEIELTHRFSTTVLATVDAFTSYVTDLIVPLGSGTGADPTHYVNSGAPVLSTGAAVEVRREWRQGWMLAASYTYQRSRYLDAPDLREVPNSPEHLGSVRAAVPLVGRAIMAMSRLSIEGPRWDRYDREGDVAQQRTDPAALWDFVISGEADRPGVHYAVGVYNAFDWKWAAPVSTEFRQRVVPQSGRTLLASIDVTF